MSTSAAQYGAPRTRRAQPDSLRTTILPGDLNHPLRLPLAGELHSRPFAVLEAPVRVSHLAIHCAEGMARHDGILASLCQRFGVAPPQPGAQHFVHDFGHFRVKWERHTEFSTFTFIEPGASARPFAASAMRHVPSDWLESLAGSILVASHIVAERGEPLDLADPRLKALFPAPPLVGSRVLSGGEIWTDFQVGPDGFSRFLVRDTGLREMQTGRLIQRICEIETYLMMALLALPLARENAAALEAIEEDLARLSVDLTRVGRGAGEEALLEDISRLAARVRSMSFQTGYRFSAASAYYRIVRARIGELREKRIEGVPTIGEFMERRLAPAMDTCLSVAARQENLADKVSRSNDLLRTHVNLAQERQNQGVLEKLSRNAQLQLRLQQAVEGLSVVAISYYGLGLAAYGLKALKGWGMHLEVDTAVGSLLPLVCGATWFGLKRLHQRLHDAKELRPA